MLHTYLNEPGLKTAFLGQLHEHEQMDAFVKGTYGEMNGHFRGCGIGCSLHSLNVLQGKVGKASAVNTGKHSRYEAELGLPTWFAYMEDHIFENLPDELSKTWPRRLAEAIPVGAVVDDIVLAKILTWSLSDADFGVRHATDREDVRGWIDAVSAFIDADSRGVATADQREAAARDARDAWAATDARDAWAAKAARDAWAARDARDAWAARAAWAAWDAWAARDAWDASEAGSAAPVAARKSDAYYPALSEYVISLLRELATVGLEVR